MTYEAPLCLTSISPDFPGAGVVTSDTRSDFLSVAVPAAGQRGSADADRDAAGWLPVAGCLCGSGSPRPELLVKPDPQSLRPTALAIPSCRISQPLRGHRQGIAAPDQCHAGGELVGRSAGVVGWSGKIVRGC